MANQEKPTDSETKKVEDENSETQQQQQQQNETPANVKEEAPVEVTPLEEDRPQCTKRGSVLLKAHRLILASCSPLIRKIFDSSSNDVLTIHFPGMYFVCRFDVVGGFRGEFYVRFARFLIPKRTLTLVLLLTGRFLTDRRTLSHLTAALQVRRFTPGLIIYVFVVWSLLC